MRRPTIEQLKMRAPNRIPEETCPLIDRLQALNSGVESDLQLVWEQISRSRLKIRNNLLDDISSIDQSLASMSLRLEELRHENACLRALSLYWYTQTKELLE